MLISSIEAEETNLIHVVIVQMIEAYDTTIREPRTQVNPESNKNRERTRTKESLRR
jgi:hypothetical protein